MKLRNAAGAGLLVGSLTPLISLAWAAPEDPEVDQSLREFWAARQTQHQERRAEQRGIPAENARAVALLSGLIAVVVKPTVKTPQLRDAGEQELLIDAVDHATSRLLVDAASGSRSRQARNTLTEKFQLKAMVPRLKKIEEPYVGPTQFFLLKLFIYQTAVDAFLNDPRPVGTLLNVLQNEPAEILVMTAAQQARNHPEYKRLLRENAAAALRLPVAGGGTVASLFVPTLAIGGCEAAITRASE